MTRPAPSTGTSSGRRPPRGDGSIARGEVEDLDLSEPSRTRSRLRSRWTMPFCARPRAPRSRARSRPPCGRQGAVLQPLASVSPSSSSIARRRALLAAKSWMRGCSGGEGGHRLRSRSKRSRASGPPRGCAAGPSPHLAFELRVARAEDDAHAAPGQLRGRSRRVRGGSGKVMARPAQTSSCFAPGEDREPAFSRAPTSSIRTPRAE